MGRLIYYVPSSTLSGPGWNTHVITGEVETAGVTQLAECLLPRQDVAAPGPALPST